MGNRMICGVGRRRAVEDRMTRPQRLAGGEPGDVDYKKLRKLILAQKLAPCYDAVEAEDHHPVSGDLEECPICFLLYPSLNRSRCCAKGICTECFLQMKPSFAARPAPCPFCKTPCYAVEYRGARTEEEKFLEQAEEQKFIEAKIRMQSESENLWQAMPVDQTRVLEPGYPISNLEGALTGLDNCRNIEDARTPQMAENPEADSSSVPNSSSTRHEEFSVNLEEIMMMEAIWHSLQDTKLQKGNTHETYGSSCTFASERRKQRLSNIRPFSAFSGQGECSSRGTLAECIILQQQIPNTEHHSSHTHQCHYGDSFGEPNGTGSGSMCSASSSTSVEDIVPEPIDPEISCSIDLASRLNTPVGSLFHINGNAGLGCSTYSGLISRELPFMLATESKA